MLTTVPTLLRKVRQSPLVKNVAILATGTVFAQAIAIIASPVLTRLYSPESFGLFATFIALATSLAPAATGKFEVAMMLPPPERAAKELYAIAASFCVLLCTGLVIAVLILRTDILDWLNIDELGWWIILAPFTLLCIGLLKLMRYAANRRDQYKRIARSAVIQALTVAGINIALGLAGAQLSGLIIGNIAGLTTSLTYLLFTQWDFVHNVNFRWSARKKALIRRYRDLPVFNASTGLLDGVMANLPIFFMIAYFPAEIAGFYALVTRVVNAPVTIISAAVSRVNLKEVIDLVNSGKRIDRYLLKIAAGLLAISLPPTMIFIFWGPQIFSFIFGEKWLQAGEFSQVLAFALSIKFVASTLSSTLGATNNNRYTALWRVVALTTTFLVLGLIARNGSAGYFIWALVLNEVAIYSFYFYLIFLAARNPRN